MLHKRLKELRLENDMTQADLGTRVGVIKQTVSSWENDTSTPNYEIVCKLADLFGVSTDYLLGRTERKEMPTLDTSLSEEHKKLITAYDALPPYLKRQFLNYADFLLHEKEDLLDPTSEDSVKKLAQQIRETEGGHTSGSRKENRRDSNNVR